MIITNVLIFTSGEQPNLGLERILGNPSLAITGQHTQLLEVYREISISRPGLVILDQRGCAHDLARLQNLLRDLRIPVLSIDWADTTNGKLIYACRTQGFPNNSEFRCRAENLAFTLGSLTRQLQTALLQDNGFRRPDMIPALKVVACGLPPLSPLSWHSSPPCLRRQAPRTGSPFPTSPGPSSTSTTSSRD